MKAAIEKAGVARQILLIPEIVELDEGDSARLAARAEELARFGLVIEAFGPGAVAVRETPSLLGEVDVRGLVGDLAEHMAEWDDSLPLERRLLHVSATMAVATGIAEGLGLGFNARAALITRGLAEMTRLGVALGADETTFAGLAGLGDLVLTCTGSLSRNRAVGVEIGKGRQLEDVLRDRETVAEGVIAAQSARELANREAVEMPIVDAVNSVLFDGQSARNAIGALMTRELRAEVDR